MGILEMSDNTYIMEKLQFEIGDLVELKSGSPVMTLVGKDDYSSGWRCGYFINGGEYKVVVIDEQALNNLK